MTGAWWDLVDETAAATWSATCWPGTASGRRPSSAAGRPTSDLWLRRTAVIAQLGHRERDRPRPADARVEANLDDRSFWLRKAIGWALRDYARTDPDWVRAASRTATGCPAVRREAIKHL